MKTIKLLVLVPALLLMSYNTVEDSLTKEERKIAVDYLKDTKKALLKSVKGLTEEQLNFKPSPESWSIAECVEHLAISETNLMGLMQSTLKEEANPERRSEVKITDEDLFKAIADRTHKVKTQDALEPTGKFGSHEATLDAFKNERKETIEYVKTTSDDLRDHFFTFPIEALGTVDAYQLIIFMAGHNKRHNLQIEEIKTHPDFPKE